MYSSSSYPSPTYPRPSGFQSPATNKPSAGGQVHYEVETSTGKPGTVVYEVHEVYVCIPAELSAAGFEIKIMGMIRITERVSIMLTLIKGQTI